MEEFLWVEKYRPHKVADCILPNRIKKVFQAYVDTNDIPNMILHGSAGVGKTTVAKAMCEEIGVNHLYINASKERGIDVLRTTMTAYASTISLTGGRKVIILDEADNMTTDAQLAFRGLIEEFSNNCTFILTCNFKSKLIEAIQSRCPSIDFTIVGEEKTEMAAQFYKRMKFILAAENVPFEPAALAKVIEKHFPDYRRCIGELQRFSKLGAIDAGVIAQLSDIRKMNELMDALKNGKFSDMRKWVVTNSDVDPSKIYRKIYDSLYEFLKPETIPQAVVTIGKYQYQAAFVADQEINLVACLTEIMVDCEFL
jgi:DNA polymerase III delta prime subunit